MTTPPELLPPEELLTAQLSKKSHEGWKAFVKMYGGNMSALAEAIGLELANMERAERLRPLPMRPIVEAARAIAAYRFSRKKRSD